MMLCVAAGGMVMTLALESFTLAWTHSIEKIRWEEDYRVVDSHLLLTEARVRGSGAGMEPPPDARFAEGVWHYDPHLAALSQIRLTHSTYTSGYELCERGRCLPLTDFAPLARNGDVIDLHACEQ